MLRHLRLARARGSLVAPNHPVQDRALEVLEVLDEISREKGRMDLVRGLLASSTSDFDRVRAQFPEYFTPVDPFEGAKTEEGGYDIDAIDDSDVEWDTPASADVDEDISRWIAEHESGSISAADIEL